MRHHLPAVSLAAVLLLSACGGAADEPASDPGVEEPTEPTDGAEPDPAAGSDPLLGPEVELAIADAVERRDVTRDEVEVLVTELVTWPDGSLGCPEPDRMYTQALVDGFRIVLGVDGEELAYHGANGDEPFLCEEPEPPVG